MPHLGHTCTLYAIKGRPVDTHVRIGRKVGEIRQVHPVPIVFSSLHTPLSPPILACTTEVKGTENFYKVDKDVALVENIPIAELLICADLRIVLAGFLGC